MNEYEYIDKSGKTQKTTASSAEEAIKNAPNIASNSGVVLSQKPQTNLDSTTTTNQTTSTTSKTNGTKTGVVNSSEPTVTKEKDTSNTIDKLISGTSDYEKLIRDANDNYVKLLQDAREKNTQNYNEDLKVINDTFASTEKQLKEGQVKETGIQQANVVRLGGFLGESASGQGVMLNLAKQHRDEISALATKRSEAILKAQRARDENDFKLAAELSKQAIQIEKDIMQARTDFIDQSIKVAKESREAENQLRDDAKKTINDMLDRFGTVGLSSLDDSSKEYLAELSKVAGVPLSVFTSPTLKEIDMQNDERQRSIQNFIDQSRLDIAAAEFDLSQKRFALDESISATEAGKLGLPKSLVGYSTTKLNEDLSKDNVIPTWFWQMKVAGTDLENKTPTNEDLTKFGEDWDKFRTEIVSDSMIFGAGGAGAFSTNSTTGTDITK